MGPEMTIEYLGDGLYDVNGKTLDTTEIATNIVQGQDGDTIDRLVRENSEKSCDYKGEDVWQVDGEDLDSDEVIGIMTEILDDCVEFIVEDIIDQYYTPTEN